MRKRRSVALLIETSNAYARGLLSGIMDYVRQHEPWSIYLPELARGDVPGSPRVIFSDPHVAAVGLTLGQAQENGISVHAVDLDTAGSAGASFYWSGGSIRTS